jgi:hypothetical protein
MTPLVLATIATKVLALRVPGPFRLDGSGSDITYLAAKRQSGSGQI